jgi:SH3-like domain-containing protein
MTPGAVVADYDVHRLARELPGDAGWVVDQLRALDYDELDAPEANA